MTKSFLSSLLLLALAAPAAYAQPPATPDGKAVPPAKTFDVATIKVVPPNSNPTKGWAGVQYHSDGLEFAWQSVPELLYFAFGYEGSRFDGQITGLPGWTDSQKYDIVAKMSPADIAEYQTLSKDQQQQWREQMV